MKFKLLILFAFLSTIAYSQTSFQVDNIAANLKFRLGTYAVTGISNDSSANSLSPTKLVTEFAAKRFAQLYGGSGSATWQQILNNGSILNKNNDIFYNFYDLNFLGNKTGIRLSNGSGTAKIEGQNASAFFDNGSTYLYGASKAILANSIDSVAISGRAFYPNVDLQMYLGKSANRWKGLFVDSINGQPYAAGGGGSQSLQDVLNVNNATNRNDTILTAGNEFSIRNITGSGSNNFIFGAASQLSTVLNSNTDRVSISQQNDISQKEAITTITKTNGVDTLGANTGFLSEVSFYKGFDKIILGRYVPENAFPINIQVTDSIDKTSKLTFTDAKIDVYAKDFNLNRNFTMSDGNPKFFKNSPSFAEFKRTDVLGNAKVSVGMLGSPEANLSFNMDYTDGVHKAYDSTVSAAWLAMSGDDYALQYAPANVPTTSGDIWNSTGQRYLFRGNSTGQMMLKTSLPEIASGGYDAMFTVPRNGGAASIAGLADLVIEGHKTTGVNGAVYINTYNDGVVLIGNGGGNVGMGTFSPSEKLDVFGRIKANGYKLVHPANGIGKVLTDTTGNGDYAPRTPSGGGGTNPTNHFIPYKSGSGFDDSGLFDTIISGNHRIGLGTTLPDDALSIYKASGSGGIMIEAPAAGISLKNQYGTYLVYNGAGADGYSIARAGIDLFSIRSNGNVGFGGSYNAEKVYLNNASGYLGINNTSPAQALDVSGSIQQSAVTSSLLKADGTGKLVAVVVGVDIAKTGNYVTNGDGITSDILIPHGLAGTPTFFNVGVTSVDGVGSYYLSADATNIIIHYSSARGIGIGNLTFSYSAKL